MQRLQVAKAAGMPVPTKSKGDGGGEDWKEGANVQNDARTRRKGEVKNITGEGVQIQG